MITDLIFAYLTASAFMAFSLLLGTAVLKRIDLKTNVLPGEDNPYLSAFFASTIGISITILAVMVLGFIGLLNSTAVGVTGLFLLCIAVANSKYRKSDFLGFQFKSLLIPALLMLTTFACAWKATGLWDDTSFHLPLARFYLDHQRILLHEYLRFPLFPQNINMLITLGFMFGDAPMAQVFATIPWFVITLGLMGTSKWFMGNEYLGILIALILAKGVGSFKAGFGFAYVDAGLALFCWAAVLAVVIGITQSKTDIKAQYKWILIAGFLAGMAAGTKIFGGAFAFLLCFYILIATRSISLSGQFGLLVLASGIWWYLRSYLISGDPFHPLGGNLFGHFLWNEQDLAAQIREQQHHGGGPSLMNFWLTLQKAELYFFTFAFIGLSFYKKHPAPIRRLQLIFIAYFCFWYFTSQVERYLAPVVVAGTFLSLYTLYYLLTLAINPRLIQTKISTLSKLFSLAIVGLCCLLAAAQLTRNIIKWDERQQNVYGYELFTKADSLQQTYGTNLVQIGFENAAYFFSGIAIGDHFGKARYMQMLTCPAGCKPLESDKLIELMKKFDSKMIIISTAYFPNFNPQEYTDNFEVVLSNHQGVLMAIKIDMHQMRFKEESQRADSHIQSDLFHCRD